MNDAVLELSSSRENAATPMPVRIAIVEDDEEIRASLASIIKRSTDFHFVRAYGDAESALTGMESDMPDVVLMDINLPGLDGVECVRRLKKRMPGVQCIMLTVYEDNERLFQSLMAGASGYLLKRTSPRKLLEAIRDVRKGGGAMTPQIAMQVIQHFRQSSGMSSEFEKLTPGEKDVLDQLSKGYLYKEIADHLAISIDTVRNYVRKIYEKLHVHSRTEAVVKYLGR
jgi:DNA-binding NarL/FixJ family response regulator